MPQPEQPRLSAADETLFPVDIPGGDPPDAHPLRWTSTALAVASLFLLLTNAVSIRDWTNDLAPGPAQARLAGAAERWVVITDGMGLGSPRAALHARWKQAEAATFD